MNFFRPAVFIVLSVLAACRPGVDEDPQPDFLTGNSAKTWEMTDARQNGLSSPLKPCLVGDTYTFRADKSFGFDEGTQKCSSNAPQTISGRWELANSTITMRQNGDQTFIVLKLKSLSSSRLVAELDNNGGPTVEYTFAAK
ncbi:MAG: lipocalin family protein [Cytophagales bacterium]|jgi:hypothetical protein|nr:lipocalin family protein [Cytophagales bacterium]